MALPSPAPLLTAADLVVGYAAKKTPHPVAGP